MKNVLKYSLVVVFLQLFCFCSSDQKLSEQPIPDQVNFLDKNYIENAPVSEQMKYKRYHLLKLATWISHNNNEVISLAGTLNRNIENKDFSVQNIISDFKKSGRDLTPEVEKDLTESLEAFINLDGEDWYPYIRFENMRENLNKSPYDDSKPLFAIQDVENNTEIAVGYQENVNGELEEISEKLVEGTIGEEDDIIVIGIGTCPFAYEGEPCPFKSSVPDPPFGFSLKIGDMKIKSHKESWPFRSDISFTGYYEPSLPVNSGNCGELMYRSVDCYNPDGSSIDQYRRKWIEKGDTRTQNFKMKTQVDYENDDIVFYVIFEHDSWPAPNKTVTFNFPNGIARNVIYRSWQSKYDAQMVSMDPNNSYGIPYGPNFYEENSDIEYDLIYRTN